MRGGPRRGREMAVRIGWTREAAQWAGARALCDRHSFARCALILLVYVAVAAGCGASELADDDTDGDLTGRFCDGGPYVDGRLVVSWEAYWPTILNTLSTLLLAFYTSLSLQNYQNSYECCMRAKSALLDFVSLAAGQLGERPSRLKRGVSRPHPLTSSFRRRLLKAWGCAPHAGGGAGSTSQLPLRGRVALEPGRA